MIRMIASASLLVLATVVSAEPACHFQKWDLYRGTQLLRLEPQGPYIFVTQEVKVDADGAPNAYHPDDVRLHCTRGTGFKGLDCPANAGYPNQGWWRTAIVPDPGDNNKGYFQPGGVFKGYFVSQTSLRDSTKSNLDPKKYVDSTSVPYLVFPGKFNNKKGTGSVGDFGFAVNTANGKASAFIVAEVGPSNASLGEMSISLGTALGGGNPNPRTGAGAPSGKIAYVVFPYTKLQPAWPLSNEEIAAKVTSLLQTVGGAEMLKACANTL